MSAFHAYEPSENGACAECGKPATDAVHAASVVVLPDEIPYLYNVLCDNPRVWNERLRNQLAQRTNATEAFNAKVSLVGKATS